MQDAHFWISHLNLKPHPEGGYFNEVYRSDEEVVRISDNKSKNACTSIYYLLNGSEYSGFHRLFSDEIWYFHKGNPLHIYIFDRQGFLHVRELSDKESGTLSVVVNAGRWFAAAIPGEAGFTLVSCVVAPGFDFSEFEMAEKHELGRLFPQHRGIIEKFCR